MKFLRKLGAFAKKNIGKIGAVAGVASLAAGFIPGVGPLVSKAIDAVGNKVKKTGATLGIGDGKPGVFGIGDGLPGIFGIGTGKGAAARVQNTTEEVEAIEAKVLAGDVLTAQQAAIHKLAEKQALADMKKDGVNPLVLLGGGLLALFAFNRK